MVAESSKINSTNTKHLPKNVATTDGHKTRKPRGKMQQLLKSELSYQVWLRLHGGPASTHEELRSVLDFVPKWSDMLKAHEGSTGEVLQESLHGLVWYTEREENMNETKVILGGPRIPVWESIFIWLVVLLAVLDVWLMESRTGCF